MAKVKAKGLNSQIEEDEHDKQVVYDTMYKTRWSLMKVLHTTLHCVKTIQKAHRPVSDFFRRGHRDVVIKLSHLKNDCLAFRTISFSIS